MQEDNARIQALDKQVRQMEDEAAQKKKVCASSVAALRFNKTPMLFADIGGCCSRAGGEESGRDGG
jgi:hypothetical protein